MALHCPFIHAGIYCITQNLSENIQISVYNIVLRNVLQYISHYNVVDRDWDVFQQYLSQYNVLDRDWDVLQKILSNAIDTCIASDTDVYR